MVVGLGSGSTAAFFVAALGRRISVEGLRVSGLATSRETAELARGLKIPLTSFAEHAQIDIVVDGADEIETGTLYLIKGRGGALLREKIVAAASRRMAVIADETKLVERLGSIVSVPVGRWGPCCSVAPTGSRPTSVGCSASIAFSSGPVSSSQRSRDLLNVSSALGSGTSAGAQPKSRW